jgi:sugar-phosphatase
MNGATLKYKGAIFDLDGLLVDSEPVWRWAQAKALGEAGVQLTEAMQTETTGLGLDEAYKVWKTWFPHAGLRKDAIGSRLHDLVLEKISEEGKAKPGAFRTLEICRDAGCAMAVASSSPKHFIRAALVRLDIQGFFQAVVSGQDVKHEKPHPEIYQMTAECLGLAPGDCLAFEDSLPGLRAAKAAGMWCVAVPEGNLGKTAGFDIADLLLASLDHFSPHMLRRNGPGE